MWLCRRVRSSNPWVITKVDPCSLISRPGLISKNYCVSERKLRAAAKSWWCLLGRWKHSIAHFYWSIMLMVAAFFHTTTQRRRDSDSRRPWSHQPGWLMLTSPATKFRNFQGLQENHLLLFPCSRGHGNSEACVHSPICSLSRKYSHTLLLQAGHFICEIQGKRFSSFFFILEVDGLFLPSILFDVSGHVALPGRICVASCCALIGSYSNRTHTHTDSWLICAFQHSC